MTVYLHIKFQILSWMEHFGQTYFLYHIISSHFLKWSWKSLIVWCVRIVHIIPTIYKYFGVWDELLIKFLRLVIAFSYAKYYFSRYYFYIILESTNTNELKWYVNVAIRRFNVDSVSCVAKKRCSVCVYVWYVRRRITTFRQFFCFVKPRSISGETMHNASLQHLTFRGIMQKEWNCIKRRNVTATKIRLTSTDTIVGNFSHLNWYLLIATPRIMIRSKMLYCFYLILEVFSIVGNWICGWRIIHCKINVFLVMIVQRRYNCTTENLRKESQNIIVVVVYLSKTL